MKILSVNELIQNLEIYVGKYVHVEGTLCYQFECCCLYHRPKSEWDKHSDYNSSIWYGPAFNFSLEDHTLKKWSSKRVVMGGTIRGPSENLGGCGHMSMWPAEIEITQLHLHGRLGEA